MLLCANTETQLPTPSILLYSERPDVGFFHRDTNSVVSIHVELYRKVLFLLLFVEQIGVPVELGA